ncbi:hypothetical protein SAMN04489740_3430 [Arthrobacter alpinus]|uniref:Uncharacterized protein n=1 Tax=Arthrobacter alpinus TaxID=656366 RepID=A0A1H5N8I7_9MICC|nr:hypothetical protein SAMN04489740_3430 [Arthrobacter alpinus]
MPQSPKQTSSNPSAQISAGSPVSSSQSVTPKSTTAQNPRNPMMMSKSSPLFCLLVGMCRAFGSSDCFPAMRPMAYFTAPAVSPATILRWKISTRITSGMVTTVPAAMTAV